MTGRKLYFVSARISLVDYTLLQVYSFNSYKLKEIGCHYVSNLLLPLRVVSGAWTSFFRQLLVLVLFWCIFLCNGEQGSSTSLKKCIWSHSECDSKSWSTNYSDGYSVFLLVPSFCHCHDLSFELFPHGILNLKFQQIFTGMRNLISVINILRDKWSMFLLHQVELVPWISITVMFCSTLTPLLYKHFTQNTFII